MPSMLRHFSLAAFIGLTSPPALSAINHNSSEHRFNPQNFTNIKSPKLMGTCPSNLVKFNTEFLAEINAFLGETKIIGAEMGLYDQELMRQTFSRLPNTPSYRELKRHLQIPIFSPYDAGTDEGLKFLTSHHKNIRTALNDYALFIKGLEKVADNKHQHTLQNHIKPWFKAYSKAVDSIYEDVRKSALCINFYNTYLR